MATVYEDDMILHHHQLLRFTGDMALLKEEIELELTMPLLNEFHNLIVLGKNDCWYRVERADGSTRAEELT